MARDEFDSDLAKLQAYATFGKSMEQVRHRVNVRQICDRNKVSRPTYCCSEIINDDLKLVRGARRRVTLNKHISVGFSTLEISKLIMYELYYDNRKPKYSDRCQLLFTYTDSCFYIQTEDMCHDMSENLDLFETSNFDQTQLLYTTTNRRKVGKFKSENGSLPPLEFVASERKCTPSSFQTIPKSRKLEPSE